MMIQDGVAMFGRFSVGWNFHSTRIVRTIALPFAFSFVLRDRLIFTVGPVTFLWLL